MRPLQIAIFVLGGLAVACLATAIVLMMFVRNTRTHVVTLPSTTTTMKTSDVVPFQGAFNLLNTPNAVNPASGFAMSKINPLVSIVEVPTGGSVTPTLSTTATIATPVADPGVVDFKYTDLYPMKRPPQGFGWVALSPALARFVVSLPNGYAGVAQFCYSSDPKNKGFALCDKNKGQFDIIPIIYAEPTSRNPSPILSAASSIGCVGYRSILYSYDGSRVYFAYQQPWVGGDPTNTLYYPFLQLTARIAVYKTADKIHEVLPNSLSDDADLSKNLINVFGAQPPGLFHCIDPVTKTETSSDDLGWNLGVSINTTLDSRILVARSNYSLSPTSGAAILIWEEAKTGPNADSHVLKALIQLTHISATLEERQGFGRSFAIGDDMLLVYVPYIQNSTTSTSLGNTIRVYRRTTGTQSWEVKDDEAIVAPLSSEDFGHSICIHPSGRLVVIGAPTRPVSDTVSGQGGSLYLYYFDDSLSKWSLKDTYVVPQNPVGQGATSDPSKPDFKIGAGACFSYVHSDRNLRLVAATVQQQNHLGQTDVSMLGNSQNKGVDEFDRYPIVLVLRVDQINFKFVISASTTPTIVTPTTTPTTTPSPTNTPPVSPSLFQPSVQFIQIGSKTFSQPSNQVNGKWYYDQLLGASCSIQSDEFAGISRIVIGSPMNQMVFIKEIVI